MHYQSISFLRILVAVNLCLIHHVNALNMRGHLMHTPFQFHLSSTKGNLAKLERSEFIPTKRIILSRKASRRRSHQASYSRSKTSFTMLRNFDLPEVVIFYGMETFVEDGMKSSTTALQPGVSRILKESKETDTCVILLSESRTEKEIEEYLQKQPFYEIITSSDVLIRSSLDMIDPSKFCGRGQGHSPCPAALMDAISSIEIQPKGFGGSSGFGTKLAEPVRSPLPKHSVVFVTGPGPTSRARCSASRLAGMRVMYIEKDGMGTSDADDLVDGVVESLGTEEDWEIITLDDISTPGSFWLNPPNPRDDSGDRVNPDDIVTWFLGERNMLSPEKKSDDASEEVNLDMGNELTDHELADILADLDPL